jgi:heme ABC exporter ATP-binding subunit CcmA
MAHAVRLRQAVSLAGRFPVLAGVSLEVDEGSVVHIFGPNGAGKSSLLRLCSGLLALHSGEGTVLGLDLSCERRELRRLVGLLGHHHHLYEELSVEENLRFFIKAGGCDPALASSASSRLGLGGRLYSTPVGRLSAGQRRRAALAVLSARDPRLWLLDEPHAGLDEEARDLVDRLILQATERGRTVLIASHEKERVGLLADRVVHVAGGRVVGEPTYVA